MSFKKKVLWLMAAERGRRFCAAAEVEFRKTFKHMCLESKPDIAVVYARVNATKKFLDDYNIHLNILQHETSIRLKCLKDKPDQTVDPQVLVKEFTDYILTRDNGLGFGVLAIDRIDKLTFTQRNMLFSYIEHSTIPFSVLFIIPQQDWDRWDFDDFRKSVKSMRGSFQNMRDIGIYVKKNSKGLEFDANGNLLRCTD